jgi:hypothetical protein
MKWFRVRVTEDAGRESGRREPRTKDPNKREVDLMGGVNKRRHRCERPRSDGNKALARQNSKARHCSRLYPARLPVPHSLHLSARECVRVSLCCVQCLALLLGAESPQVLQQASTAVADFPWLPISSKAFTPAPAAGRTAVHRPMGRSSFIKKMGPSIYASAWTTTTT